MKKIHFTTEQHESFTALFIRADAAGWAAAEKVNLKKVCDGFGFVYIKLYKSDFAKWYQQEKCNGERPDDHYGIYHRPPAMRELDRYLGVTLKETYADAFSKVLSDAGIQSFVGTRLD